MKTEMGLHLEKNFPNIEMQEDIFDDDHYWVTVRLGEDLWISIEVFSEGGCGVSTIRDGALDFGGHDEVFDNPEDALRCIETKLAAVCDKSL